MKLMKICSVLLIVMALVACASGNTAVTAEPQANIITAHRNDIAGIDWYLLEVRNGNNIVKLNRTQLESEGNGDIYRLRFDRGNLVSGKAAPNTYRGPCQWGNGNDLEFGVMALTMIASLNELSTPLKEHDYLNYLRKVKSWTLTGEGWLELFLSDESGQAALIFERRL